MFPISDENERGHGPAFVTLGFIALNVAVFVLLQGALASQAGLEFTYGYAAIPIEITQGIDLTAPQTLPGGSGVVPQAPGPSPIWLTLLTSMFMHGGWLHLLGNMLYLWIFGDNVEHRIGHVTYAFFYVAVGIVASLAQILVSTSSVIPTLGASGAIAGVLGAYLVLFPGNRVLVILIRFPVWVPALVAIGMWAALQVVGGFGAPGETGGIAYMAHIGGFVAGVAGGLLFRAISGEPRHPRGTPASMYR